MLNKMNLKGRIIIFKKDKNTGDLVEVFRTENMIVQTGFDWFVNTLDGLAPTVWSHIAIGTNNTVPNIGQTALLAELAREAFSDTDREPTLWRAEAEFAQGVATGTWGEVGVFNAAAAGTMLNRAVINVTKAIDEAVTVRFELSLSNT